MGFEERFRNTIREEKAKSKNKLERFRSRKQRYEGVLDTITPSVLKVCKALTKVKRWNLTQNRYTWHFHDDIPIEGCPAVDIELRYPKYLPRFITSLLGIDCDRKVSLSILPPKFPRENLWDELVLQVGVWEWVYNKYTRWASNRWTTPGELSSNRERIFVDENSNKNTFKNKLAELLERATKLKTDRDRGFGHWNYYISGEKVKKARIRNLKLIVKENQDWVEVSSGDNAY